MIKSIWMFASITLVGVVFIYTWYNRDSDRVILTFATAMMIGAMGFITKESISNKVETIKTSMPVAVFYGLPEYRPLTIDLPYRTDLQFCLQELPNNFLPEEKTHIDINFGQDKYFEALQYILISKLFGLFNQGWLVEVQRINGPSGLSVSTRAEQGVASKTVQMSDMLEQLPNNFCVERGVIEKHHNVPKGKAEFPESFQYEIIFSESGHSMTISMSTDYIDVTIELSKGGASIGIGEYGRLLDISDSEMSKLANATYTLKIEGTQSYFKNGHPEMKKHRAWAESIIALYESEFDFREIREGHLRRFQIYRAKGVTRL